ncbi:MAG TPA: DegT/DnrJ/EryC1/StrS family aminotransferase [Acidobacteriota bacterium]|nr:DegT/DnrJ/EryC1/StrS family aminotransferase [Acidobacteriota bacterium]
MSVDTKNQSISKVDLAVANRWPMLTTEDEEAVLEVIRDGDLSCHRVTRQLEEDYREFFGMKHALAHCNGTAAMLASFFAAGLETGDEVLVPSATFWASVVPMLWTGAIPVFCESELDQLGLDPEDVERRVTPRTRAIVVVHLWGMPSKMSELMRIARRHNLLVIEDASHAHGALYMDKRCGTFGDVSVFSLQSSKLAPAGEGGMLMTNSDQIYEQAICLGDMMRVLELESPAKRFYGTTFGVKTRMAPLSAAIGRVQFARMQERNDKRNANLIYLSHQLEALGFDTFLAPQGIQRVYFEYLIRRRPGRISVQRDELIGALRGEGCDVSAPRYPLLHQQPLFREGQYMRIARPLPDTILPDYRAALPQTEKGMEELIRLPAFPAANRDHLDSYVDAFERVVNRYA